MTFKGTFQLEGFYDSMILVNCTSKKIHFYVSVRPTICLFLSLPSPFFYLSPSTHDLVLKL